MPANILNLPCYKVLGIQENEHDYHIDVETLHAPTFCPHCQSSNLVGFGRREQMVKDLPMHGRRVGLYIDTRRYRCRNCGKTFYEVLPEIDEKRLMTKPLRRWTGPSTQEYEVWRVPAGALWCKECTLKTIPNSNGHDCHAAPCYHWAILRIPGDPPSWPKEQK